MYSLVKTVESARLKVRLGRIFEGIDLSTSWENRVNADEKSFKSKRLEMWSCS